MRWDRRNLARLLFALALLLLVAAIWKAVRLLDVSRQALRDTGTLVSSVDSLRKNPGEPGALARLGPHLRAASVSLERLEAEARPLAPAIQLARCLPPGVGWVGDVPDALAAAVPLVKLGATLVSPFSAAASEGQPNQSRLVDSLAAANSLRPSIPHMRDQLEEATAALEMLRGRPLGGPLRPVGFGLEEAFRLVPSIRQGLDLLAELGPALGMEGPRTYLLLGQNNQEIRATGGFIGSLGVITLDNGAVARLDYGSSYAVDGGVSAPPAPAPLARYMGLGGWYLRDANWWPDFPSSAAQVEQAWARAGRGPIDGIVALDNVVIEAMLRAVGGVELECCGLVTGDNFEQKAGERLYSRAALASAELFHQAKGELLGAVCRALVEKLYRLPPDRLLPLGQELLRLLETKQLQLAVKNRALMAVVNSMGWDGSIPSVQGDSLYIVDTTVSYGDTYSFIRTRVELDVSRANADGERHMLVLHYFNSFPEGLPPWVSSIMVRGATFDPSSGKVVDRTGFWGNWLRLYLPPTARGVETEGLTDSVSVSQQFGRTLVSGYLLWNPASSGRSSFATSLRQRPSHPDPTVSSCRNSLAFSAGPPVWSSNRPAERDEASMAVPPQIAGCYSRSRSKRTSDTR